MRTDRTYEEAAHAMQTGVAFEHGQGSQDGSPKHLRVGVNSAQVNQAALARLLIEKGMFTEAEYIEAIRLEMNAEANRYEERIQKATSSHVNLA